MSTSRGLVVASGAAFAGCASLLLPLPLLHVRPADLGPPRTLEQRVQFARHGASGVMDAVVDLSPTRVQLVATALGVRLYDVDYDGQHAVLGALSPPLRGLPPTAAIDDFLLLYADSGVLNAALPRGFRLVAGPQGRRLYRGERLLVEIEYESADPAIGRSHLHNLALGYDLVVDSTVVP